MENNTMTPPAQPSPAQPSGAPTGQQGMGGQEAQPSEEQVQELTKQAVGYIYGEGASDEKSFSSLVQMLKAGGKNLPEVVSTAAVAIIDKLEKENGQLPVSALSAIGQTVVLNLLDLSQDIGLINGPDQKVAQEALGMAMKKWMSSHEGRVDPEQVKQHLSAEGVQPPNQGGGMAGAPPQPGNMNNNIPAEQEPMAASPAPTMGAPAGSEEGLLTGA